MLLRLVQLGLQSLRALRTQRLRSDILWGSAGSHIFDPRDGAGHWPCPDNDERHAGDLLRRPRGDGGPGSGRIPADLLNRQRKSKRSRSGVAKAARRPQDVARSIVVPDSRQNKQQV